MYPVVFLSDMLLDFVCEKVLVCTKDAHQRQLAFYAELCERNIIYIQYISVHLIFRLIYSKCNV